MTRVPSPDWSVCSSRVFSRPDTGQPGVHVIMLDGRWADIIYTHDMI